jgi:hypothetical protein
MPFFQNHSIRTQGQSNNSVIYISIYKCNCPFVSLVKTLKLLHRLPSNFDTTFNSNRSVFSYMYHTHGTPNTRRNMKYVCRSGPMRASSCGNPLPSVGRTTNYARVRVANHSHLYDVQATHSAITFRRSLPTIQWRINKLAVHDYMQLLPALLRTFNSHTFR